MRSTIFLAFSACALVTATGAIAAEPIVQAPIVEAAPYFNWSGGYIGLQGGYASSDSELRGGIDISSDTFDGGMLGAYAGYNWQYDALVFGAEADINGVWNDENFVTPGFNVDVGTDFLASLRGSVGYSWNRAMLYATGGVAFTSVSARGTVGGIGFDEDRNLTGWTLGAGVQYAFTDNWIGRAEYRFYDFGDDSLGALDRVELQNQTVTVGAAYKF